MTVRPFALLVCAFALMPAAAWAQAQPAKLADAGPGVFRVFAGTSMKGPLESVLPALRQKIGKPILVEYGGVRGPLHDEIVAGQEFEVAILLPDTNEELIAKGKILPRTYRIAGLPIAVGIRGDAPVNLDVSTEAGLKAALLGAKSVKYSATAAAIDTVKSVLAKLDVAGKIRDTSTQSGEVALGAGEYELYFNPYPELEANKAYRNLGDVIAPLQVPARFDAAIGAHASDPKAALAFVTYLQSPALDPGLKASGMMRPQ
jgi:molybdate transport system substrate-binding protein